MLGAALGFPVTLCLPANASPERQGILRALGAELVLTDPLEGTDGAIQKARGARRRAARRVLLPGPVLEPRQLARALRDDGARDLGAGGGRLTHFVAGLGTTGTFLGVDAVS